MARIYAHDMAKVVAAKFKLPVKDVERFIFKMFDVATEGLQQDRSVKIKGLGTFKVSAVKERQSVNISTGERVVISGHEKVTFTPDSTMKDLVNKPFAQFETVVLQDGVEFADMPEEEETASEDVVEEPENQVETPSPAEEEVEETAEEPAPAEEEVEETAEEPTPVEEEVEETVEEPAPAEEVVEEAVEEPAPIVETLMAVQKEESVIHEEIPETEEVVPAETPVEEEAEEETPAETPVEEEPEEEVPAETSAEEESAEPIAEEASRSGSSWWRYALLGVACLLIGFFAGRYSGRCSEQTMAADSLLTDTVAMPVDSVVTEEPEPDVFDFEKVNSDPRLRYGAYEIVGVDTVVTLREGQTMKSYCRATLGSEMVVYFQVLNGVDSMSTGDALKVPKVRVKKRK